MPLWPRGLGSDLARAAGEQAFGHFIKIGRDGRVTVAVPQVETGQGIWTALPQIVADELGAAWETVAVEPAPLLALMPIRSRRRLAGALGRCAAIAGSRRALRITAGSTSVRAFEQPLRTPAAMARAMLIAAAAERWNVDAEECDTADGFVLHGGQQLRLRRARRGSGGLRSPPRSAPLRSGRTGRLTGKPLPRLDLPAKSDGSFRFAADVRLPDMLFASARMAPPGRPADRLSREARAAVRASPCRRRNDWLARRRRRQLVGGRARAESRQPAFRGAGRRRADVARRCSSMRSKAASSEHWFERGDYDSAVEGSRPLAATYWVAPAQHLGLEPLTATARFSGGAVEVWAPTQAPELERALRRRKARAGSHGNALPDAGRRAGGRALEADAIPLAVALARELKRPVQLDLAATAPARTTTPCRPARWRG